LTSLRIFLFYIWLLKASHLQKGGAMRLAKALVLILGLLTLVGVFFLIAGDGDESRVMAQPGKLTMWGDDVLVNSGYISRYARNGYACDYDENSDAIFAAVTCYSSSLDTCYCYASPDGGLTWNHIWNLYSGTGGDLSNPQVVSGEGIPYQFFFVLDQTAGTIVVHRRIGASWTSYNLSGVNESFSATRDNPGDQNYYLHMSRATNLGEVMCLYSTNHGENWQTKDTVDGDMPHIAAAGSEGGTIYLTWRLDGEDGAFYGVRSLYERVAKNPTAGTGTWKYYAPFDTSAVTFGGPQCILQASDGSIYVGIDTAQGIMVQKSRDGGETWISTDDFGDQADIGEFLEGSDGAIYVATGRNITLRGAKVYKTTDGGVNWNNTGDIGEITDDWALCLARSNDTIYVGTMPEGDVFRSTNGGDDWTECHELPGADAINDIIVTQLGTVIAVGDTTGFFWSGNGGDFWYYSESPDPPSTVWCLFQASDGTILAGAAKPASGGSGILKSTNNGLNWSWTGFSSSGYFIKFILEASNSYLYTSDGKDVYRSINHGDTWTAIPGSPGLEDMILSKHQIAVKKSTNRGVTWGNAEVVSGNLNYEKSDPKVAGTSAVSPTVWVTYSEKTLSDDWDLKYAYTTGSTWSKNHTLSGGTGDQQLCDLASPRESQSVHATFCSDHTGSRKLYYTGTAGSTPTLWYDTVSITGIIPTLAHTPEISFYQNNPLIFFCGVAIGPQYPWRLWVDALHFTDVEEEGDEMHGVVQFSLSQNYPNPFNPVTSIQYTVDSRQTTVHTTLKIYNIRGQLVRTLVDELQEAGEYQIFWDGKSDDGEDVASGIYLCELKIGDYSQTKKMVLIR
jgi:hypothetical protein